MKKKEKKRKKMLIQELNFILERNRLFCVRNEMDPYMYMEGVSDTAGKIKKIVKKIYK